MWYVLRTLIGRGFGRGGVGSGEGEWASFRPLENPKLNGSEGLSGKFGGCDSTLR